MKTLAQGQGRAMAETLDLHKLVQHHDGQLHGLNTRMGHVESTLGDHGKMLRTIESAVTTHSARPTFNFHQSVSTVLALAILFSMVCGGIIWITSSQFATTVEKVNGHEGRLSDVESGMSDMREKLGWIARVDEAKRGR